MKLRISDNSIRIRVSNVEAEKLMQFETIQMTTGFPADTQLSCQLIPSKVDDLGCTFSSNSISIFIPESMIEAWKSSGGKQYVPDGRPGMHSPFARKFLVALRDNGGRDKVLTLPELYGWMERINPEPKAGGFGTDEPGSDFVFVVK